MIGCCFDAAGAAGSGGDFVRAAFDEKKSCNVTGGFCAFRSNLITTGDSCSTFSREMGPDCGGCGGADT